MFASFLDRDDTNAFSSGSVTGEDLYATDGNTELSSEKAEEGSVSRPTVRWCRDVGFDRPIGKESDDTRSLGSGMSAEIERD